MKDTLVQNLINQELERQNNTIELIASENITSKDVMEACGSVLTNKYSEGMPPQECDTEDWENIVFSNKSYKSKRYYNGCEIIDKIETLACNRFKTLFNTDYHINVQPHSGAQANMAVFEALLKPGDTILSMDLSNGGHLSHGSSVNYSGKHYNIVSYGVNEEGIINYEAVEELALKCLPTLIICGASNYSKIIDFERFAQIRDKVIVTKRQAQNLLQNIEVSNDTKDIFQGHCYLLADIAHIAGLIAGGVHPSPFNFADVVTTTTHKSLRGPRGGVIACKQSLAKKIDSAVFPGIQGGPLEHIIAAKAVCFGEALLPSFKDYANQIIKNSKQLCKSLLDEGMDIVGGMTENHLMTLDLRRTGLTGKDFANELEKVGITANKNTVPNDPQSPFVTSGIRLGTPAVTTRGFKEDDMTEVAKIICTLKDYMISLELGSTEYNKKVEELRKRSNLLCSKYPIYKE